MTPSRHAVVKMRIESARETLEDARTLAETQRWRGCLNRLYYACFYAVVALLETDGRGSSKHSGVRSLFQKNYVHTGMISKDFGRFYSKMMDHRTRSDYDLERPLPVESIPDWIAEGDRFIEAVVELIYARNPELSD